MHGLDGNIMRALEKAGYVPVHAEEASAWAHLREQNEILVTAIHVLSGFSDPDVRVFADEIRRRIAIPDGATPFDDLRMQLRILEDENENLRRMAKKAGECLKQR
ncbi:MAG: hypothetical protein ACYTFU_08110 [Planctomycetota bacterium]|jgi:hypothetical protein